MKDDTRKELADARSIMDVLTARSGVHPEKPLFFYYNYQVDNSIKETRITYSDLYLQARKIAGRLRNMGAEKELAILLYPPGLEYISAFMGCLFAGVIAVPAYPPFSAALLRRFRSIIKDCRARFLLTTTSIIPVLKSHLGDVSEINELQWISTDDLEKEVLPDIHFKENEEEIAFIQYTSGSTSAPKGVGLTHHNLLDNSKAIQQFMRTSEDLRGVIWLPFYHDMGLIGGILQTLFSGGTSILFSPLDFLKQPFRWLQTISNFKATISGGPNFAFDLCVRRIKPEQIEALDLSSWKVAFTGAEPIRRETLTRFYETFKKCGFKYEAFYPCYGLAESTLIVTGGDVDATPVIESFDKQALEQNHAIQGTGDPDHFTSLISSGRPLDGNRVVIVHPESNIECISSEIGEIWVQSPSVAKFYLNKPEESRATFEARLKDDIGPPFLRTGDLGFIYEGELFITGRLKDVIIIRGKNYYPSDIEEASDNSHEALRAGCGAAFSIDQDGEEKLVVVQEIKKDQEMINADQVKEAVRRAVLKNVRLIVHEVVLIRHGRIPKTSSGKIQRHACKAEYLNGSLEKI